MIVAGSAASMCGAFPSISYEKKQSPKIANLHHICGMAKTTLAGSDFSTCVFDHFAHPVAH
jgi:hypothetical protein